MSSENAYADVVLLLDVSGRVDAGELVFLKQAANSIVDAYDLANADGRVRIGMVRFRGSAAAVADMTDVDLHGASEPLHNGINGLVQGAPDLVDGTNIVAGLNSVQPHFATGLGDRANPPYPVPNIAFVITDGEDTHGDNNSAINAASDATGAKVYVIGVGEDVSPGTINSIASEATSQYSYGVNNFSDLPAFIDSVVTTAYADFGIGTTFTIESVSPDGTVSVSEVVLPPE